MNAGMKLGASLQMVSGATRKTEKIAQSDSFEAVAREWFAKFSPNWAASHSEKIINRLDKDIYPWLGKRPIASITAADLLTCLRRIESRGALDTAHRAYQNCSSDGLAKPSLEQEGGSSGAVYFGRESAGQ